MPPTGKGGGCGGAERDFFFDHMNDGRHAHI